jgi:hypothetical protein
MWLEAEGSPDARNRIVRNAHLPGHLSGAPMGGCGRLALQSLLNELRNLLVVDGPRRSTARQVAEPLQTCFAKALAQASHRRTAKADASRDLRMVQTLRHQKNRLGAFNFDGGSAPAARQFVEEDAFLFTQFDGNDGTTFFGHAGD